MTNTKNSNEVIVKEDNGTVETVTAPTTTAVTETATGETATAEQVEKPKKHVPVLEILSATYGISEKTIDAKEFLSALGIKLNNRKLTNKIFDGKDPAPKKIKTLSFSYRIDGGPQVDATIIEGEKIELEMPVSTVTITEGKSEANSPVASETTEVETEEVVKELVEA